MRELVQVCSYDIRDRKRVRFHKSGKYVSDYPYDLRNEWGDFVPSKKWEDKYSYNNGKSYAKCGILLNVNPFAIGQNNVRTQQYVVIRRDHAEKFAEPCRKCFR